MIEYINSNAIRLIPSPKRSGGHRNPKRRKPNAWERKVLDIVADSVKSALDGELFLRRQLRRARDYEVAILKRGYTKDEGRLRGWSCQEGTRVMRPD